MAGIPQNFQSISPVIANYDFVDIASGTGYINFYAGTATNITPTTTYSLSNFTFYADPITTSGTANSATYTKVIDLDFDVTLNRPLDIRGVGIVNVGTVGGDNQTRRYVIAKIRKWDGSTETEIANNSGDSADDVVYSEHCINISIPLTHFKIGETLRLTIEVYVMYIAIAGNRTVTIAHDPMNRVTDWDATGAVPSKLMFQCPVRLNL